MTFIVNVHVSFVHFLNPVGETKLEKKKRIQGGADHRNDKRSRDGAIIDDSTEPLLSKEETRRHQNAQRRRHQKPKRINGKPKPE